MARLWSCGFELNSLSSGIEFDQITGSATQTLDTTIKRSGTYSYKIVAANFTGYVLHAFQPVGSVNITGFFRGYIYFSSLPSAQCIIFSFNNNGIIAARVDVLASGAMAVYDKNGNQVGSTTAVVLTTGQWYRFEFQYKENTAGGAGTSTAELLLDGTTLLTATTVVNAAFDRIFFGVQSTVTCTMYWDDIAVNDNNGSTQNSYPGAGAIVHLRPNAAGDNAAWTIAGSSPAATNWQSVNEVTPDDGVTYMNRPSGQPTDDHNIDSATTAIPAASAITVVQLGSRIGATSSTANAARQFQLRLCSASGGTRTTVSAIPCNTTGYSTHTVLTTWKIYQLTSYTDPTTGVAWTVSGTNSLDNAQIGIIPQTSSATDIHYSTLWLLVDYVPALVPSVSDSVTVSESVALSIISFPNKSDTVTVTESVNIQTVDIVNKSDTVTVTESVNIQTVDIVNLSDSVTVTDVPTLLLTSPINVNDSVTVTESVAMLLVSRVSVSDAITITESVALDLGNIHFDASSSSNYEASLSTYNWSHTTTNESNRLLVVGVSVLATGTVTGITYDGNALTFLRADSIGVYRTELWYLKAPATGTKTIAVTLSISATSIANAATYYGVHQTTPFEGDAGANGTGNPATVSLATTTDTAWVVSAVSTSDTAIVSSQRARQNNTGALGTGGLSDRGAVAPPATVSMDWTGIGTLDTWALSSGVIKPFGGVLDIDLNESEVVTVTESSTVDIRFAVNVNDAISVTESVTVSMTPLVTVSDSITVVDAPNVQTVYLVSVNDVITVTESVNGQTVDIVSVNDAITVSESVVVYVNTEINVNDSVTVTDVPTVSLTPLLSVSDSITVTDAPIVSLTPLVNVSDAITVSESTTVIEVHQVNVSDAITVSETVVVVQAYLISVYELDHGSESAQWIIVDDVVIMDLPLPVSVNDSVSVSELISANTDLLLSVSDAITVSESVSLNYNVFVNVNDSITVTESVSVTASLLANVFDAVTVFDFSDDSQLVIVNVLSVIDTVTVSEFIQIQLLDLPSVSDSITVSDVVSLNIPLGIAVSDSITVVDIPVYYPDLVQITEFVNLAIDFTNSTIVSDSITVSESVTMLITQLFISVNDAVTITEAVTVFVPTLTFSVSDAITITESVALEGARQPIASDAISVTESVTVSMTPLVNVNDSITVADVPLPMGLTLLPSVSDAITVAETVAVIEVQIINKSDSITVTDVPTVRMIALVNVFDTITVTESISTFTTIRHISVSDSITVSECVRLVTWVPRTPPTTSWTARTAPTTSFTPRTAPTTDWGEGRCGCGCDDE